MESVTTDVCIIGAGPSGLTLALLLLRSGCRVTVVERSASFDREYRGEIIQPGGLQILDEIGVLTAAQERGAHVLDRFRLTEGRRTLMDIDYGRLPPPFSHMLSLPQRHLLEELAKRCGEFEGFSLISGSRISGILTEDDTVVGAVLDGRAGIDRVHSLCVVGADGRYSKTRSLAGLDLHRSEDFALDVLWFRLPAGEQPTGMARIHRSEAGPVLVYDCYPDMVQIGLTLPHQGYQQFVQRGFEAARSAVKRALPEYADQIDSSLRSLKDLTLLDVFAGQAGQWARDGLVLTGDSAHTHSPLGAQGINLALQDAALLHPVLVAAVRAGDAGKVRLDEFQQSRSADIQTVMRIQVMQSRGMLSQSGVAAFLQPRIAGLLSRTPLGVRMTRRIALGNESVRVHSELFVTP